MMNPPDDGNSGGRRPVQGGDAVSGTMGAVRFSVVAFDSPLQVAAHLRWVAALARSVPALESNR